MELNQITIMQIYHFTCRSCGYESKQPLGSSDLDQILTDVKQLENIWRFVSLNGNTKVIHLAATLTDVGKEDVQKFIKELRNSEVRMILFSRGAILVEGPSDKIVIEKLERVVGKVQKYCDERYREFTNILLSMMWLGLQTKNYELLAVEHG